MCELKPAQAVCFFSNFIVIWQFSYNMVGWATYTFCPFWYSQLSRTFAPFLLTHGRLFTQPVDPLNWYSYHLKQRPSSGCICDEINPAVLQQSVIPYFFPKLHGCTSCAHLLCTFLIVHIHLTSLVCFFIRKVSKRNKEVSSLRFFIAFHKESEIYLRSLRNTALGRRVHMTQDTN